MNIKSVIEILQEKNDFSARHPEFVGYVGEMLRSDLKDGDKIVLQISRADGTEESKTLELSGDDTKLLNKIGRIFK